MSSCVHILLDKTHFTYADLKQEVPFPCDVSAKFAWMLERLIRLHIGK
jgi:hypothetical protein